MYRHTYVSTLEKAYRAEMFCLFDFYYANCSQIPIQFNNS